MKISIVYDTKSGYTAKMAEHIIRGIQKVQGIDAKAFNINAIDSEYVKESVGLIVGSPTYNGYLTADLKAWLEKSPAKLNVQGKLGGAYATAGFIHGGGELAIQCILTHLLVDGMMVYSSGQAMGMPVIHIGPIAISPNTDDFTELFVIYGERFALQAKQIFA